MSYLAMAVPVIVVLVLGFILGHLEGWPVLDSIYYVCITVTTIGFGDVSPQTSAGRAFAIFFLPVGVLAVTNLLRVQAESRLMAKASASETSPQDMLQKIQDLLDENKAAGGDGSLNESEYVLTMVVNAMGLVSEDTVAFLRSQFRILDQDGSGGLDADDMALLREQMGTSSGVDVAGPHTAESQTKEAAASAKAALPTEGAAEERKQPAGQWVVSAGFKGPHTSWVEEGDLQLVDCDAPAGA